MDEQGTSDSQQNSEKAETITAHQWATVAEDVKAGRCFVLDDLDCTIVNISTTEGGHCIVTTLSDRPYVTSPKREFKVTWRTMQPAPASEPAIPTDGFDLDGFQHAIINMDGDLMMGRTISEYRVRDAEKAHDEIVADLQAENAALHSQLATAEGEVQALRTALKKIASKSDPERPKKWDAEMDTSFGITLGWWSAGVIARAALEASQPLSGSEGGKDELHFTTLHVLYW